MVTVQNGRLISGMSEGNFLVMQSDFGYTDGAVAAMTGVALTIDGSLRIFDATHDIEPYNIWEASYRLFQTIGFWRKGTVFLSVVDPGVGSVRRSIAAKTSGGSYVITPDNGTLTHIGKYIGIEELREIDESEYLSETARHSYTFCGRDLYVNVAAKLASGIITFEETGKAVPVDSIVKLTVGEVTRESGSIKGHIDILDARFGSIWTDITREDFLTLEVGYGEYIEIVIRNANTLIYSNRAAYGRSFADVNIGEQIVYVNSLMRMALAINQGNFARAYSIGVGLQWTIEFKKI